MSNRLLRGPFLTRTQAARRAGVPGRLLKHRPDLLVVDSEWLPEVYFAFQFDEVGVHPAVGAVVQALKPHFTDLDIADWLVRPNRGLGLSNPMAFLTGGGAVARVLAVAETVGPIAEPPGDMAARPVLGSHSDEPEPTSPVRRPVRRPRLHRPIFHGR